MALCYLVTLANWYFDKEHVIIAIARNQRLNGAQGNVLFDLKLFGLHQVECIGGYHQHSRTRLVTMTIVFGQHATIVDLFIRST